MESTYKPLTEDTFMDFMKDLYKDKTLPDQREWVLMTGQMGMESINRQMQIQHSMEILTALITADRVTTEEVTRLSEMINSPDRESLVMANLIMDQK